MLKKLGFLVMALAMVCSFVSCSSSYSSYDGGYYDGFDEFSGDTYDSGLYDDAMAEYRYIEDGHYIFSPKPGGNATFIVTFSDLTETSVNIEAYSHDLANYGVDDYDYESTSVPLTYTAQYDCYEFEYLGYWRLYSHDLKYLCYEHFQSIGQGFSSVDTVNPEEVWWYEEAKRQTSHYTDNAASDFSNVTVGDTVTFGSYEMDNDTTNGAEAIPWLVLDESVDGLFVVSQYCLTCQEPYDGFGTWETCEPRVWLNSTFYNTAFSSEEQEKILLTTVANPDNAETGIDGGNDTNDYVFLLSIDEVERYFPEKTDRYAYGTLYLQQQVEEGEDAFNWWLRSPGDLYSDLSGVSINQAYVGGNGFLYKEGTYTSVYNGGLRPAMWIAKS